jgi:hypothetical protein
MVFDDKIEGGGGTFLDAGVYRSPKERLLQATAAIAAVASVRRSWLAALQATTLMVSVGKRAHKP